MAFPQREFTFHKHDTIGAAAAEDDQAFLRSCFIDTGDLAELRNPNSHKRLIIGRTGAGKSALLLEYARDPDVHLVEPESLSLNYVANSTIIRFFHDLGVNLDPFYKLLWRHLFAVEVFKTHHNIFNEHSKQGFLSRLLEPVDVRERRKSAKAERQKAIDYMNRYGNTFWEDTEYRAKEITSSFENELHKQLSGGLGANFQEKASALGLRGEGSASRSSRELVSEEERVQLTKRGQEIVNSVQVKQLSELIDLVDFVMQDSKKRIAFVVDHLDENWVDETIKYRLIKSLIDTSREFLRVSNVKIIIALRTDLMERVLGRTQTAGFQQEKYRSIYFPIAWDRGQLARVIERRITQMAEDRHKISHVKFDQVFPKEILPRDQAHAKRPARTAKAIDYFLDRSWMRPRDIIEFVNLCIGQAKNKTRVTTPMILAAEGAYSASRLAAISDEWKSQYPLVADIAQSLLRGRPKTFRASEVTEEDLMNAAIAIVTSERKNEGTLYKLCHSYVEVKSDQGELRSQILSVFYKTGICGLKLDSYLGPQWVYSTSESVAAADIGESALVLVHPGLWRVLGIGGRETAKNEN